jgi:hypothetical protein
MGLCLHSLPVNHVGEECKVSRTRYEQAGFFANNQSSRHRHGGHADGKNLSCKNEVFHGFLSFPLLLIGLMLSNYSTTT